MKIHLFYFIDIPVCGSESSITAENFSDESLNGLYTNYIKFDETLQEKLPEIVINHHPVFVKESKCIWFNDKYGVPYWYIGNCENVGIVGDAYLREENGICPFKKAEMTLDNQWTENQPNGKSINGKTYSNPRLESDGTNVASSTAGVGYTVENGYYKTTCEWEWTPNGFTCT